MALGVLSDRFIKMRVENKGFKLVPEKKKAGLMWLHERKKVRTIRDLLCDVVRTNEFLLASNQQLAARVDRLSSQTENAKSESQAAFSTGSALSSSVKEKLAVYLDEHSYIPEATMEEKQKLMTLG